MFIENIKKEDIVEFITTYHYNDCVERVAKARDKFNKTHDRVDQHSIWIEETAAESWNPQRITEYIKDNESIEVSISGTMGRTQMTFTDFDFQTPSIIRMKSKMHDKNWLKFMYSKMCELGLGEEYKSAFAKCREEEKENLIKATIKSFDKDTEEMSL